MLRWTAAVIAAVLTLVIACASLPRPQAAAIDPHDRAVHAPEHLR